MSSCMHFSYEYMCACKGAPITDGGCKLSLVSWQLYKFVMIGHHQLATYSYKNYKICMNSLLWQKIAVNQLCNIITEIITTHTLFCCMDLQLLQDSRHFKMFLGKWLHVICLKCMPAVFRLRPHTLSMNFRQIIRAHVTTIAKYKIMSLKCEYRQVLTRNSL